jgi:hypothetical protein
MATDLTFDIQGEQARPGVGVKGHIIYSRSLVLARRISGMLTSLSIQPDRSLRQTAYRNWPYGNVELPMGLAKEHEHKEEMIWLLGMDVRRTPRREE